MRALEGWRAGIGVALLALAVRVVHLFDVARLPIFDRPSVDAALYVQFARDFAERGLLPDVFYKPPLYPVLLGTWWQVVGDDWMLLRLPGIVFGALSAMLVWWLGRAVFDGRVALVAGLLYALHGSAVYFEAELLEMGLVTCVQTAALLMVVRAGQERTRLPGFVAGCALGLGCLARPTFLPVTVFSVAWLGRRHRGMALAGALLLLAPVTLHNAWRGGDFVLISSNLGVNFYIGNNPWANGRIAPTPELPAQPAAIEREARRRAEAAAGHELRPSEVSRYWLRRGLRHATTHPLQTLELLARKTFYAAHGAAISDNEDLPSLHRWLHLQPWLPVGMWILVPLGIVGMIATSRRSRDVRYLQVCLVLQVVVLLPFFVVERFRLPWAPLLALFAAYALVHGVGALRRRTPEALRGALAFLILLLLCNLPVWGVRQPLLFDLEYKLGYAWQQKGDLESAMRAYRLSIQHNPQGALARNALGWLLAQQGRDLDEAVLLIEEALRRDPTHTAHYAESLAFAHLQRRDAAAALRACERGLAVDGPAATRASLLRRRAQALHLQGDRQGERQALRQALAIAPRGAVADSVRARLEMLGPATPDGSVRP